MKGRPCAGPFLCVGNDEAFLGWGAPAALELRECGDWIVIVDVLSFSTCVDIAASQGAAIYPFPLKDREQAQNFAASTGAFLAGRRKDPGSRFTLSPQTLFDLTAGDRIVLPSPNGSAITSRVQGKNVVAACLRNARAVVQFLQRQQASSIAVIAAGELRRDETLRPALEDFLGAGAVLAALRGEDYSPEADVAVRACMACRPDIERLIVESEFGRELREIGFAADVDLAVEQDCSASVPVLFDGAYREHA